MFYLVYDPSTYRIYGFFPNNEMAKGRIKDLNKSNPEIKPKIFPYNMNVYIDVPL